MTKGEARAFIEAFVRLRGMISDEMSLQVSNLYPAWKAEVNYTVGQRVLYNETLYKVLQDHTSQEAWNPVDAPSLFARVLIPDETIIPEWVQPDSTNTYKIGDKVTHNGQIWVSTVDNNSWEPGVYGWEVDE
jgi:chitodextrinase